MSSERHLRLQHRNDHKRTLAEAQDESHIPEESDLALKEWWDARQPDILSFSLKAAKNDVHGLPRRDAESVRQEQHPLVLFRDFEECIEAYKSNLMRAMIKSRTFFDRYLPLLKKIVPDANMDFFHRIFDTLVANAEQLLHEKSIPTEESEWERLLTRHICLRQQLRELEERFEFFMETESARYYTPLIHRARSDVMMFLIKEANTAGIAPAEAQRILADRAQRNVRIVFKVGSRFRNPQTMADTNDVSSMRVNVDKISFIKDHADETSLLETLAHEYAHVFSHRTSKGRTALEDPGFFADAQRHPDVSKPPQEFFNEITTETVALMVGQKYYRSRPPGVLRISRLEGAQKWNGYYWLMEDFSALEERYFHEFQEMKHLMIGVMLRGEVEQLQNFFSKNPELLKEVQEICTLTRHFGKQNKKIDQF